MLNINYKDIPRSGVLRLTSGERLNCSFHSTLISLFDYILADNRTDIEREAILNNRPISFLEAFNREHHCNLTTQEFIDWVRSHRWQGKVDVGFIQMLAPTLRKLTHDLHLQSALGRAMDGFCRMGDLGMPMGMQEEATFNYLYLIFGVPITIRNTAYDHVCDVWQHIQLELAQPENQQDEKRVVLYVHQNSSLTHFSSMGYTLNGYAQESTLSTRTRYPGYISPTPLLEALLRLRNKQVDPLTIALQEDINAYFGDNTKCQIARNLGNDYQQEADSITSSIKTINSEDFKINAQYLKHFFPKGNQQDLEILALWIKANISTSEDINNLIQELSTKRLRVDRVLYDLLLVVSIIGITSVIHRRKNYYITTDRTRDRMIQDLENVLYRSSPSIRQ